MTRVDQNFGHKKVKTSVSLSPHTLEQLKRLAKREHRSVSNMLEYFIEQKLREITHPRKLR
jgi:hypothetical protein